MPTSNDVAMPDSHFRVLRLPAAAACSTSGELVTITTITSWVARWSGLLAVAAQRAYAATLLELPPAAEREVLAGARWD